MQSRVSIGPFCIKAYWRVHLASRNMIIHCLTYWFIDALAPDIQWWLSDAWSRWRTSAAPAWSPERPAAPSGTAPPHGASAAPAQRQRYGLAPRFSVDLIYGRLSGCRPAWRFNRPPALRVCNSGKMASICLWACFVTTCVDFCVCVLSLLLLLLSTSLCPFIHLHSLFLKTNPISEQTDRPHYLFLDNLKSFKLIIKSRWQRPGQEMLARWAQEHLLWTCSLPLFGDF